jgi:hypothetical protein
VTRIVCKQPPNIAELRKRFNPPATTCYAWGDRIYNPAGGELADYLVEHERAHFAQQARVGGPDAWWRRYIDDPAFRLEQELEAYRVEWRFVVATVESRARRRELLAFFAKSLASRMYGGLVSKEQARRLITAEVLEEAPGTTGAGLGASSSASVLVAAEAI